MTGACLTRKHGKGYGTEYKCRMNTSQKDDSTQYLRLVRQGHSFAMQFSELLCNFENMQNGIASREGGLEKH
jgi:hypothetical protein